MPQPKLPASPRLPSLRASYSFPTSLLIRIHNRSWIHSGTGVRICYFLSVNDRGAILGAQPQGQLGALVVVLQCAQKVHQVPRVFRLDHVGEGRHRRAIEAGHENLVEVLVRLSALGTVVGSEVVRPDWLVVTVCQS